VPGLSAVDCEDDRTFKTLFLLFFYLRNVLVDCLVCLCAVKTLCENERDQPVVLGSSVVDCEDDGTFKPLQCNTRQSECWCVDGLGNEVNGTRTSVYIDQHKPNCGTSL